jgi:hypothetical protein
MVTLAPHLSRHQNGIREEERLWLGEGSQSVSGNGSAPGCEEPHN